MDTKSVDFSLKSISVAKRTPKCTLCNNHGRRVSVRGHKPYCPFASCACIDCKLTKTRRIVMAKQVALRRFMELDDEVRGNNGEDLRGTRNSTLGEKNSRDDVGKSEIHPTDTDDTPASPDIPLPNLTREFDYYKPILEEFHEEISKGGLTTSDLIRSLLRSNDFNVENTFRSVEKVSKQIQLSQEFHRGSQNAGSADSLPSKPLPVTVGRA